VIAGQPGNPCDRLPSAAEANQASGLTGFVTPMDVTTPIESLGCQHCDGAGDGLHLFVFGDTSYQSQRDTMRAYGNETRWFPQPVQGLGTAALWLGSAADDYANSLWVDTGRAVGPPPSSTTSRTICGAS
jgi:hypothetical protein